MNLTATFIITLIILVTPFIIYFKNTDKRGKMHFFFACIIYLIIASPVINGVINNKIAQDEDANIGLGFSFFITWFLTFCAFLISLYFLIKNKVDKAK